MLGHGASSLQRSRQYAAVCCGSFAAVDRRTGALGVVNTADRRVIKSLVDKSVIVVDPNMVGSGRENLEAAVQAKVALEPVSLTLGAVPSGSGMAMQANIVLTNVSGCPQTLGFGVANRALLT